MMGPNSSFQIPEIPFRNQSPAITLGNFLMRYQESMQRILPFILRLGQLLSR